MKKILYLHGFFASGQCQMALTLGDALAGRVQVISPDLPLHPAEALNFIHDICDREHPDLLVGNSCGSFYGQIMAPVVGVPALLSNPHLDMPEFLVPRIGERQYKSPRADGRQTLVIDEALVDEFRRVVAHQFDYCSPYYSNRVWGIFGEHDDIAHYESLFARHYSRVFRFPGGHAPTADEIVTWHVPLIEKMLLCFNAGADGCRYFRHFKGGMYRFISTAFDSETCRRMVVYQALYGERRYWVRPEQMFFERIERDDKCFNRFTEIDFTDINPE